MKKVSKQEPLLHYHWGDNCDGWNLVEESNLSVKLEKMPPGTSEVLHYHRLARQFFFILKGNAHFEIDGKEISVAEQEGIQIEPGTKHRISNRSEQALEFILSSQPSTAGDRVQVDGM